MSDTINFWKKDTDENIVRTWLLNGTGGQTYSINDRFLPRMNCVSDSRFDFNLIESDWDDIIGYKHDYRLDDEELEPEVKRIVKELNDFIAKVNANPDLYFPPVEKPVEIPIVRYTPVNLYSLLNESEHEVWFHIKTHDGKVFNVWSADFHGDYAPVTNDLVPYYNCTLGDGFWVDVIDDPENDGKSALAICVELDPPKFSLRT